MAYRTDAAWWGGALPEGSNTLRKCCHWRPWCDNLPGAEPRRVLRLCQKVRDPPRRRARSATVLRLGRVTARAVTRARTTRSACVAHLHSTLRVRVGWIAPGSVPQRSPRAAFALPAAPLLFGAAARRSGWLSCGHSPTSPPRACLCRTCAPRSRHGHVTRHAARPSRRPPRVLDLVPRVPQGAHASASLTARVL